MKQGVAFPDYIKTEKPSKRSGEESFWRERPMRGFLLIVFLFAAVSILLIRLFDLQLIKGSYYRLLSESNRTRTSIIHSPRGIIFDRNGIPLVFNIPGFRKTVGEKTQLLTREQALPLLAKNEALEVDSLRQYPYKDSFAHVLGYIGQISKEELVKNVFENRRGGDLVGKTGLERTYEEKLVGIDGKKLSEVDALGNTVRTLGKVDPHPGEDIKTNLDAKLQLAAFEAFADIKKGAIIVSTPKGEILALISKPTFDSNLFTLGDYYRTASSSAYQTVSQLLLDDRNQPLLNRAIAGTYPPGSTFKLITAAASLEQKIIDENFQIEDTGVIAIGPFSFSNWYFTQYGKKDGFLNVVSAIKRSNDVFFYKLAELVGVEKLSAMAEKFGLGRRLGIDLEDEAKGIVPTSSWKENTIGEPWFLGDTYHYGIGQGYLLATPLQVNSWTQTIANGGTVYQPHFLKNSEFRIQSSEFLNKKTISLIREGMIASCSPGGVAWPLFEFRIQNSKFKIDGKNFLQVPQATFSAQFKNYRKVAIACKTGTAQHGGKEDMPHAWITLFAPAYDPQIVVTVLAESSGEGSNIAAPIAKKILEEWFGR
ncbi:MAG: penicillin-binding transpeptidase domain-containing protein [bacterium]|nr:penicillin-binding transpeptidase domain-containing protein [bacterium]